VWAAPAPYGQDWSSPRELLKGFLGNELALHDWGGKLSMGHLFMNLRTPETGPAGIWTGMSDGGEDEEQALVLSHGYGLGVMGADQAGRLDTAPELQELVAKRTATGRIAAMRVLLPEATGARLKRFLDEFEAAGDDQHYGGANRPRYGEGGGCGQFAAAMLELAGVFEPEVDDAWRVEVRIPLDLYGGPLTGRRVSILDVFLEGRWAEPDEPHVPAVIWEDPTRAFEWMGRQVERVRAGRPGLEDWRVERRGEAWGLVRDARDAPTPTDPIWRDPGPGPHPYGRQPGTSWKGRGEYAHGQRPLP
jgi:hypothetical protein